MKFNNQFFTDLLVSPGVEAAVVAPAEDVAGDARVSAPVDSGDYRDGIVVRTKKQKRVVALVQATDEKSMIVEAKTGNLARALKGRGRGR